MYDLLSMGPRWYVISLRPRGQHQPLRDAARRAGHALIALSPVRIVVHGDATTRASLQQALDADATIFTSPNAVAAARSLVPLEARGDMLAIGEGTAQALRRAGVREVSRPSRMEGDALLALPVLADVAGRRIGLVTAPGGRDAIAPALRARGAQVVRADVYTREACGLPRTGLRALRGASGRLALALTSGEALDHAVAQLEPGDLARLRAARVVASSERLAAHARRLGFGDVVLAAGPRPSQIVGALRGACD